MEFDPTVSLQESPTGILGVNHIGLSVQDLDRSLDFYLEATGFELLSRQRVQDSAAADALYARPGIEMETAVLRAPNWLLELSAFGHNRALPLQDMPVIGPGMSHTCYQSPQLDPVYLKFAEQGARLVNRGDEPVYSDLYGVSYVYAYDPEGNLMEMEHLEGDTLDQAGYHGEWAARGQRVWMSQVSLFTPDRDALMAFYEPVLGIKPNRVVEVGPNAFGDNLFDIDEAQVKIGWFRLNHHSKMMEILQFVHPATPAADRNRVPGDLGYTFSLEVDDIGSEYQRLRSLGVEFFSEPQQLGEYWQVFARDLDGNVFSLRQVLQSDSACSVRAFDP